LDQTKGMQNRSMVVNYQRRFAAHLDEVVDSDARPVRGL